MTYIKKDKLIGRVINMMYFNDTDVTIFDVETKKEIKYYLITKDKGLIYRGKLKK